MKITKDDHKRISMEHVLFAKQELERRKKAPVHVKSEEIWVEGRGPPMRKVRLTVHTIYRPRPEYLRPEESLS